MYREARQIHDISITDVTTDLKETTNSKILSITVTIENKGDFSETFNFAVSAGPCALKKVRLSLSAGSSTTVTATVPQSYQVTFVDGSRTTIKTIVSVIPEEFNAGDNEKYVYVEGINILSSTIEFSFYPMIIVFILLVVCLYGFIKMFVSERSLLLLYYMKVKSYFTKRFQ